MESESRKIEELEWKDVREKVKAVNPELAGIIDNLSPSQCYKLIKVSYNYGDLIINDGVLQLPNSKGNLETLSSHSFKKDLKDKLGYTSIPLFLSIQKSNEVFIDTGRRIIPLNLMKPGTLLGLFESIDFFLNQAPFSKWSISAGARSIFMLPKITDGQGIKRLCSYYQFPFTTQLSNATDHWNLFKLISQHKNFEQPWCNKVIIFTKSWLDNTKSSGAWSAFQRYILKSAWDQARFAIKKIDLGINWEQFAQAVSKRHLKPNLYLADHARHIIGIATGIWPGFRPSGGSENSAPTQGIQKSFIEIYRLRDYIPTIMHAYLLNPNNNLPVYYSLNNPALLEGSPQNSSSSTIMLNIKNIKTLFDTVKKVFDYKSTKFPDYFTKNTKFDYFHVEEDIHKEINSSESIQIEDKVFSLQEKQYHDRTFCSTSPFWRGVIRISII